MAAAKDPKTNKNRQDETGSQIDDSSKGKEKTVDAIKTGDKKQHTYYDNPADEQMYDSFDDISKAEKGPEDD